MKIAIKCLSVFLCVVLLASCADKDPNAACVKEIKEKLSENFSEDNYAVWFKEDDNALMVCLLQDGIADDVAAAMAGNEDILDAWSDIIQNLKNMCLSFMDKLTEHNITADCVVYICDTENRNLTLLYVKNGLVEYDVLAGVTGKTWKKQYVFSSGNYTAGVDFGPGTYDIEAIDGFGNVYDDQLGGINLIMATASEDTFGIADQSFKNAYFPDGVVLTVSSVKIRMKLVED